MMRENRLSRRGLHSEGRVTCRCRGFFCGAEGGAEVNG